MAEYRDIVKYLKRNDKNLYNEYKDTLSSPVLLVNKLVRHYQWYFEIRDFSKLDLQDRRNKNYLNLFMYALETDHELANNFINFFTFSLKNAFDIDERTWNIDLIFNSLIHQSTKHEFYLVGMYVLIAATFDRFIKFFDFFEPKEKLGLNPDEVFELFLLIVNQSFYEELKTEIARKRLKSFYHKSDVQIDFRTHEEKEKMHERLEKFKLAQKIAEVEFDNWDVQGKYYNNGANLQATNNQLNKNNNRFGDLNNQFMNAATQGFYSNNNSMHNENSFNNSEQLDENQSLESQETKTKFKPNPNIKIIKLKTFNLQN